MKAPTEDQDRAEIVRLMQIRQGNGTSVAYRPDDSSPEALRARARKRLQNIEAEEAQDAIQVRRCKVLAKERGWIVTKKRFGLEPLITGKRSDGRFAGRAEHGLIDHVECFRLPQRPYRPVALLSHSYQDDREKHLELARECGLAVEFLDWSWYYPDRCLAALYIRM